MFRGSFAFLAFCLAAAISGAASAQTATTPALEPGVSAEREAGDIFEIALAKRAAAMRSASAALQRGQAEQARELFSSAFKLFQEGSFEGARLGFEQGLVLDPGNGAARYFLGETLVRLKQNKAARDNFELAMALAPMSAEGLNAKAALERMAQSVPASVVNAGLIGEVIDAVDKHLLATPDFSAMLLASARSLESGVLKGRILVTQRPEGILAKVSATRVLALSNSGAPSAASARDGLVLLGNLAHEVDTSIGVQAIENAVLNGALKAFDDDAVFLDRKAFREVLAASKGTLPGGIGIEIDTADGWPHVVTPLEGGPAGRAGIGSGDRIVSIDGASTQGMPLMEVVRRLRGEPGARVTLGVLAKGTDRPREAILTREVIRLQPVKARLLSPDLGYVRISQFSGATTNLLAKVAEDWASGFLRSSPVKGIVLDLRDNPGGDLARVMDAAGYFIPEGYVVANVAGRSGEKRYETKDPGRRLDVPLVVLVNEGTAAGAEILAEALRGAKRAVLLGNHTFGKGIVRTILPLKDGSAVQIPTHAYKSGGGKAIDSVGIAPDIAVEGKMPKPLDENAEDVQLQSAIARLKQMVAAN